MRVKNKYNQNIEIDMYAPTTKNCGILLDASVANMPVLSINMPVLSINPTAILHFIVQSHCSN